MVPSPEDDFQEVSDEATRYARSRGRNLRRRQVPAGARSKWPALIFLGLGIAVLVVVLSVFLRDGGQEEERSTAALESRMNQLEGKLSRLEGVAKKVDDLQTQLTKYQRSASKASGSWEGLEQRLDRMSRKLDTLEKAVVSAPPNSGGPAAAPPAPPSGGRTSQHEVLRGETLYGIARQYGISVNELRRLNKLPAGALIHPGQKLAVPSR